MRAEYDKTGDRYERGDDDRCPVCGGSPTFDSPEFVEGSVQVEAWCECGAHLVFNYRLANVVAEADGEE